MAYSRTAGPVTHQASQRPVLRLPLRFLGKTGHPVPAIPSHLAKLPLRFLGTILCRPAMDERGPMDEGGSSNGRAWFREFPAEVKTDWDSSRFWVQLSGMAKGSRGVPSCCRQAPGPFLSAASEATMASSRLSILFPVPSASQEFRFACLSMRSVRISRVSFKLFL